MRKLQFCWPGIRPGFAGIVMLAISAFFGLAATKGWSQPANDYFANAQPLNGNAGTVYGSNAGATLEPGEPIDAGKGGGKTIWYTWTAPQAETIEFDTEGSDFDTVIGVYTGTSLTNLTLVAQNDDVAFPSDLTSRVDFPVVSNMVYYISVDGNEGDSGDVILNWSPTGDFSAGNFGFASSRSDNTGIPLYIASEEDSSALIFDTMTDLGMHARVKRSGGNAGKVTVNYIVTNVMWTDVFITNYYGTNVYVTNSDTTYTNILFTNLFSINQIANYYAGKQRTCQYFGGMTASQTNYSGYINNPGTVFTFNTVTNAGCPPGVSNSLTTTNVTMTTNGTTIITSTSITNIFCYWVTNMVPVPSATPNVDYSPSSGSVTLNDYQLAADIPYTVLPNFAAYGDPLVNPTLLRNHLIVIQLSNPSLDPSEDTNLLSSPAITTSNAYVLEYNLNTMGFNPCATTNQIANFQKSVYWVAEHNPLNTTTRTARVYVERTGTNNTGFSVDYTADLRPDFTPNAYNTFPLQAGSDYATPPGSIPGSRENPHYNLANGTLTWAANDNATYKSFDITINYDPAVQFNEDIILQLLNPQGCVIGQVGTSSLVILFNDQPAGAVDRNHNPDGNSGTVPPYNLYPGAGSDQNTVYGVAVQPNDSKTVLVGDFVAYNTVPRNRIARMNLDGSLDTSFMASPNSGANNTISTVTLQPDGRMIIGGVFTSFNATNRFRVARLNTDGTLDLGFNPGFGANATVWSSAIQTDGKILIGGDFTFYNQTNRNHIARLNTDGSLDTNFVPGIGPNGTVNTMAIQADGKIVIGGQFTEVDNTNYNYVARLNTDGTLDGTFNPGLGADQPVYSLTEQQDGRVIAGGAFSTINLTSRNGIARLNADGSIDQAFNPGTGADDVVYTTDVDTNGNILIGGLFKSFNGTRRVGVARLLPGGSLDTSFMDTAYNQFAGLVNDLNNEVIEPRNFLFAIGLQSDGGVIIGGRFSVVGGGFQRDDYHYRMNIARLIGGSTPGPGNLGLAYNSYTLDMPDAKTGFNSLFVSIIRTNGLLGPASVTFQPNPLHQGQGSAVPNTDYLQTVTGVTWGTSWSSGTWMASDDKYGINANVQDYNNNFYGGIGPEVFALYNPAASGNLGLDLQLSQPLGNLSLGGEPISTGVALALSTAPMTLVDDAVPAGTLVFSAPQFYVNESGTNAVITVIRTNGSTGPVSVQYQTIPGTAQPGATNDYIATSGTLNFNSGETNKTFDVRIVDNFVVRPDRSLTLALSHVTGGGVIGSTSNAVLTIINDNFLPGMLSFSSSNYVTNQNAGLAAISVIRLGGSQGIESISYSTSDGSASSGLDYIGTNGVLTWNSGDTTPKNIYVRLLNSGLVNSNLTVNLSLFNAVANGLTNNPNATQPPTNATLTIINDNFFGMPTLSASNYFVNENGGGVVVTVNRLGGSSQTITVDYSTSDGTAIGGVDYTPVSGTLVFTNGQISQSFFVPVTDNDPQTNNQAYFNIVLGNPTPSSGPGGAVSLGNPSTATVTIIANQVDDQPPGAPDKTFTDAGFNATVYSLALQNDGSIVAGGDFTQANGLARNHIARLNANGDLDIKFSSGTEGANQSVRSVVLQTDGQILVGGLFTAFNGVNENYIARLNYDGTLDSTFETGVGADNPIYAIAEAFPDGGTNAADRKILVGGSFASIGQAPYRGIAQLNEDGSVDTTFNTSGANGTVYALAVYSTNDPINGGKIILGGDFTMVNGTNVNHIARLNADGTLDSSFNNQQFTSGPNDSVRSVAIQVDGRVVIGGLFTSVNGNSQNYIARLNTDGTLDSSFNVGAGANDAVTALTLQQDLKVVAGGAFTLANSVTRNRLTRLNSDGSPDAGINFGQGANNFVSAVVVQPDGKIVIGGGFTQFDGQSKPYIARLFGGSVVGEGTVQFTSALYQANEKAGSILITVQRVGGTGDNGPGGYNGPVDVNFSTLPHTEQDGLISATDGVDYMGVTNLLLTFQPGETFQTVLIPLLNDPTNMGELYADMALTQPGDPTTDATLGAQPTAELGIIGANSTVSFSSAFYAVNKNASSGTAAITIVRNDSTFGPASIDFYTTTNGTATAGLDYTPVTNTVQFADGQSNATVLVPIIANGLPEGNLTVGLALQNPTNTALDTVLPTSATLTIVDNSLAPGNLTFSTNSYSVLETATNAIITVIRTNGSVGQVSVHFSTSDGTATNGVNYIATNGTLSFVDGQLSKSFSVPIINNTNVTSDVTLSLTLSNPSGGATITGKSTETLTILNQNFDVNFAQLGYFVDEKNGSIQIGVNRTGNTNSTISVNFATSDATAFAGTNYVTTSGTLVFLPGETFQSFTIPILYDPQITGNLIFFVNLSTTNGSPVTILTAATPVTVIDDDSGFVLASPTNSVVKGATNAQITVLRVGSTTGSATVGYATTGGTALAGGEYIPTNGVLTFASGVSSNSFVIPILNDNQIDGNQTVNYALTNSTGGTALLSPSNGVLTIIDNESGVAFSSAAYSVQENGVVATITVVRSGILTNTVSVNYATSDGTAHAPGQYSSTSGTLVFTNGQTSATFQVPIIDNNVTGGSETVLLLLSNPSASATLVSPSAATLTILNNDGSLIVPAGSAVISPANSVITPGASVTALLSLRNTAGATATNVTATLLATNGVTPTGTTTQNYGNLIVNGPSAFQQFTFTASGTNGGTISAVLQLHFDNTNTGIVSFSYTLGTATNHFSNTNYINILDDKAADPYPSSITITSLTGVISKLTTTVSNLGHAYVSDVSMLMVGPAGQKELLMEQNGGRHTITNVTLTFDSTFGNVIGTNAPVTGTYAPAPVATNISFPTSSNGVVAPPMPYDSNLGDFIGANPNGTYSLYVDDTKPLDSGSINNGWSLTITTLSVVAANNDLVIGLSANPSTVILNSNLTYTIAVTNAGPSPATGVTVSDILPVGVTLVSVSPSQGTFTTSATNATFNLGNLANNATAYITVTVEPNFLGTITNAVSVGGNEIEDNPGNNTASLATVVTTATADMAIGATVGPTPVLFGNNLTFTLSVTNLGPGTATGVFVTNTLPAGMTLLSDTASGGYTNASGLLTSALGTMGNGASQTFSIVLAANSVGTANTGFGVSSGVPDPLKGNNVVSLKSVVEYVPLSVKLSGGSLDFSWSTSSKTYRLQSNSNLFSTNWVTVTNTITQNNGQNTVTVPVSPGTKFFRLIYP
jgi:uncharacterized repeat protein (TIGR01451 family)/uncharacterized delta-60 repeat protein